MEFIGEYELMSLLFTISQNTTHRNIPSFRDKKVLVGKGKKIKAGISVIIASC